MKRQQPQKREKQNSVFLASNAIKSSPLFVGLLFGLLMLLSVVGCSDPKGQITANLGKLFTLAINQTAFIASENLRLKFLNVVDSRCPIGATCVWAGEARVDIQVGDGSIDNLTLVEPGYSVDNSHLYKDYKFYFQVQPYPEVNKLITDVDYRLQLRVEKQ